MAADQYTPIPSAEQPEVVLSLDPQTHEDAAAWLQRHRLPRDRTVELEDGFRHWLGEEGFEQVSVDYDAVRRIWELRAACSGRNRECRSLAEFRGCMEQMTGVMNCHVEDQRIVAMTLGDKVGAAFRLEAEA